MKTLKRFVSLILVFVLVVAGIFIKDGYDKYKKIIEEKPLESMVAEIEAKENYTLLNDIPDIYVKAVVAAEDKRFYMHKGFDVIGTMRAISKNIEAKKMEQGGSTITQQLAKNMYFPLMEHTMERKITELFIAHNIEKTYSKEKILELYMNIIYYGSGYYCIYDASMGYFNKKPSELNDFECTLLAGIPNAPSVYSLDVNPDLAYERQQKVIECMVECGYISEDNDILNDKNGEKNESQ